MVKFDTVPNQQGSEVQSLASIGAAELHTAIADAVIDGLANGCELHLVSGLAAAAGTFNHEALRRQRRTELADALKYETTQAARKKTRADNLEDEELAAALYDEHIDHRSRARTLAADLEALDAASSKPATASSQPILLTGDSVTADASVVLVALARLRAIDGYVDDETATAIGTVLEELTLDPGPYVVHGSCYIALPTGDGVVRAGPFHFEVENRTFTTESRGSYNPTLAAHLTAAGYPCTSRKMLRITLEAHGMQHVSASLIARNPLPVLGDAVAHILGLTPPPADTDPSWTELIKATYFGEELHFRTGSWGRPTTGTQLIIDLVAGAGGRLPRPEVSRLMARLGRPPNEVQGIRTQAQKFGEMYPVNAVSTRPRFSVQDYVLWGCPHCGTHITTSLRLPEIPLGLLCGACLRTPDPESPVYPSAYLTLAAPVSEYPGYADAIAEAATLNPAGPPDATP